MRRLSLIIPIALLAAGIVGCDGGDGAADGAADEPTSTRPATATTTTSSMASTTSPPASATSTTSTSPSPPGGVARSPAEVRDVLISGASHQAAATEEVGVITYAPDGVARTQVARVAYRDDATADLYYPPGFGFDHPLPAVIIVNGFSATAESRFVLPDGDLMELGSFDFQNADSFISLANVVAASGSVAVVYGTGDDPSEDLGDAAQWLRAHAPVLSIDADRVAVWMFSAHTLIGLRAIMATDAAWQQSISCAVVYYGWMPHDEVRSDLPIHVVKALDDDFWFIESIDRFLEVAALVGAQIDYHEVAGPHAFDLDPAYADVSARTLKTTLEFLEGSFQAR